MPCRYISAASSSGATDQLSSRHRVAQGRVRVDLEQVERRVLGTEPDETLHRDEPVGDRLLRQPHHQVERDVVEAGRARHAEGLARPRRRVEPAETLKLLVPEGLDTEAQTIDAGGPKSLQPLGRHRLGIGLERDLGVGRHREGVPACLDDRPDFARLEQRRRAAAKENGVGVGPIRLAPDLLQEGGDVLILQVPIEETTIEVAVVTDR